MSLRGGQGRRGHDQPGTSDFHGRGPGRSGNFGNRGNDKGRLKREGDEGWVDPFEDEMKKAEATRRARVQVCVVCVVFMRVLCVYVCVICF